MEPDKDGIFEREKRNQGKIDKIQNEIFDRLFGKIASKYNRAEKKRIKTLQPYIDDHLTKNRLFTIRNEVNERKKGFKQQFPEEPGYISDFPQVVQVNTQEFVQQKLYMTQIYILFAQIIQLCILMHIKTDEHGKLWEGRSFMDLHRPLEEN